MLLSDQLYWCVCLKNDAIVLSMSVMTVMQPAASMQWFFMLVWKRLLYAGFCGICAVAIDAI